MNVENFADSMIALATLKTPQVQISSFLELTDHQQHVCVCKYNTPVTLIHIYPRDPTTLSKDDWGVQSPPQQSI